jgi:hypothetical protein
MMQLFLARTRRDTERRKRSRRIDRRATASPADWNNGRLLSVSVQYPRLIEARSLSDLAHAARGAIGREFKQMPDKIVLCEARYAASPPLS